MIKAESRRNLLIYIILYIVSIAVVLSTFLVPPREGSDIVWLEKVIVFFSFLFLTKYTIYMLVSPWYEAWLKIKKIKYVNELLEFNPKVSVVIPAWNEEVGVLSTVKSLLASSYKNLEIIVVNDGSTDNTDTVLRSFVSQYKPKENDDRTVIYCQKENGGKGSALNKGVELSKGEIIVTIDADSVVHKDAIQNFVAHFVDPTVMAAVGNVKIGNLNTVLGVVQYLEFLFSFYLKRADSLLGSIYIIGGAAGAFRREVFTLVGLYQEENITEDIEITVRIQKAGFKIVYASEAVVYTEGASDIRGLLKQRHRWKRGRIDTFILHRNLFFSKKHNKFLSWFVLPFAVLGDTQLFLELPFILFLYVSAFFTSDFDPFFASLLIISLVFIVQMFSNDRKYNKKNYYLLVPISWLLFYLVTFVELNALLASLKGLYKNEKVRWQKWQRQGL